MTQITDLGLLERMYGSGIHLYTAGVLHEGWWIVPVDWGGGSYTVSYFDPRGTRYPNWQNYPSIAKAIAAGHEFVNHKILEFPFSPSNLTY